MSGPFLTKLHEQYTRLNLEQRQAVDTVIESQLGHMVPFPIVEGPPGTGKTVVAVVAAGLALEKRRKPVVLTTFTHTAANCALEYFSRLGGDEKMVVRVLDSRRRMRQIPQHLLKYCLPYRSQEDLMEEERLRLRNAQIIVSTVLSLRRAFTAVRSPVVILDEISQVASHLFFGYILGLGRRWAGDLNLAVAIGDPEQLPVVTSQAELEENISSFVIGELRQPSIQLKTQYRMATPICEVVNALRQKLFTYRLEPAPEVAERYLDYFAKVGSLSASGPWAPILLPEVAAVLITTEQLNTQDICIGSSIGNHVEAQLAAAIGRRLEKAYPDLRPVYLTPYRRQRQLLAEHTGAPRSCLTIHEAQGQEYPVVILSCVRANKSGSIGFLGNETALAYVGVSRAMAKLIVIMDRPTFDRNDYFKALVEAFQDKTGATIVSATEEMVTNE